MLKVTKQDTIAILRLVKRIKRASASVHYIRYDDERGHTWTVKNVHEEARGVAWFGADGCPQLSATAH